MSLGTVVKEEQVNLGFCSLLQSVLRLIAVCLHLVVLRCNCRMGHQFKHFTEQKR